MAPDWTCVCLWLHAKKNWFGHLPDHVISLHICLTACEKLLFGAGVDFNSDSDSYLISVVDQQLEGGVLHVDRKWIRSSFVWTEMHVEKWFTSSYCPTPFWRGWGECPANHQLSKWYIIYFSKISLSWWSLSSNKHFLVCMIYYKRSNSWAKSEIKTQIRLRIIYQGNHIGH